VGVVAQGLATSTKVEQFKHTANHQTGGGRDARHARLPQNAPKRPMTLSEADAFVERLLTDWLRALLRTP
jgi:hypothetical protein